MPFGSGSTTSANTRRSRPTPSCSRSNIPASFEVNPVSGAQFSVPGAPFQLRFVPNRTRAQGAQDRAPIYRLILGRPFYFYCLKTIGSRGSLLASILNPALHISLPWSDELRARREPHVGCDFRFFFGEGIQWFSELLRCRRL